MLDRMEGNRGEIRKNVVDELTIPRRAPSHLSFWKLSYARFP